MSELDVSTARRKVSCFPGLLLAAAGVTGSSRGGVSTSAWSNQAVRLARCSSRAASLPHVCASLLAKPVSARCTTHLAALRPGTCIYIIRRTSLVYTSADYPLLGDLCVRRLPRRGRGDLRVKTFLIQPTAQKTKTPRSPGALILFSVLAWNFYDRAPAGISPPTFSSNCSLRYTKELMSYVANSNPCPWVIASVGQASTQ